MEAWQIREYDQQVFVSALAREVREVAENSENYDVYMIEFAAAILEHLGARSGGNLGVKQNPPTQLFLRQMKIIEKFGRLEVEKLFLLNLLFKELTPAIFAKVTREYLGLAVQDPKRVYGPEIRRLEKLVHVGNLCLDHSDY